MLDRDERWVRAVEVADLLSSKLNRRPDHAHRVAQDVADKGALHYVVAKLHNLVEDDQLGIVEVDMVFGWEVANSVAHITRRSDESYSSYVGRVALHPVAKAVKVASLRDNLRDVDASMPSLRVRYEGALKLLGEKV